MDPLGIIGSTLLPRPDKRRVSEKRTKKEKIAGKGLSSSSFRKKMQENFGLQAGSVHFGEGISEQDEPEALLDSVYQLGEELKRKGSLENLEKYRRAVRQFYRLLISRSLETEKVNGRLNLSKGSRKQYTLIKVVDEKLEKLGAAVLKNQKEQLDILEKIDEIHGILVDMLG